MHKFCAVCLLALSVLLTPATASAQGTSTTPPPKRGWDVALYPVFAWVPIEISFDVNIPPADGDSGGSGDILDSRFDGAYFGGLAITNGTWRFEADGLWAGFGGDRPESPFLRADVDLVYGHAAVGRKIVGNLYLTGGVRRVAFKYDVALGDLPELSRKPGVWDPLVGIGWHVPGPRVEWHAAFEGGGFGVGADQDFSASLRVDWKALKYVGFTAGYNFLYLKITDTKANRPLTIKPLLHGPLVGIGLYF